MQKINYTCAIDIGTHHTKVMIISVGKNKNEYSILSTASIETKGMRSGYIVKPDEVAESIKKAISIVENNLKIKIKKAYVSVGGIGLSSTISNGIILLPKELPFITNTEITKVIENSEENLNKINKSVIHIIPIGYKLDGKDIFVRPEGLQGGKLEVRTLFITLIKQNLDDLINVFELLKIDIEEIVASPIATSNVLINTNQKTAGCILVDIGYETVSTVVFENSIPISVMVFPIGSMDITKDIALGLKISLEEAESIKLGSVTGGDYSKKKVDEIIEARLVDIFELIGNQLKRLKRNELLPAGIIITGNGSMIKNITMIARNQLKIPSKIGLIDPIFGNKFKVRDSSWYTTLGLILKNNNDFSNENIIYKENKIINNIEKFFKNIFSQLLP